tara:strand:- start:1361 stop:1768 length:408 start_codon:yes stop_codon:yes gene_type:complete
MGGCSATARHVAEPAAFNTQVTRASRAFFEAGGFEAQLAGVTAEVSRALADCPDNGERHVLNAGCGEGAYLRLLQREQARRSTLHPARRTALHIARRTESPVAPTPHSAPPSAPRSAPHSALCTALCRRSSGVPT